MRSLFQTERHFYSWIYPIPGYPELMINRQCFPLSLLDISIYDPNHGEDDDVTTITFDI